MSALQRNARIASLPPGRRRGQGSSTNRPPARLLPAAAARLPPEQRAGGAYSDTKARTLSSQYMYSLHREGGGGKGGRHLGGVWLWRPAGNFVAAEGVVLLRCHA